MIPLGWAKLEKLFKKHFPIMIKASNELRKKQSPKNTQNQLQGVPEWSRGKKYLQKPLSSAKVAGEGRGATKVDS